MIVAEVKKWPRCDASNAGRRSSEILMESDKYEELEMVIAVRGAVNEVPYFIFHHRSIISSKSRDREGQNTPRALSH